MDPSRDLGEVAALLAEAFGRDVVASHRWFFHELRLLAWLTPWLGSWVFGPGVYGSSLMSFVWLEEGHVVGHASVQRLDPWGDRWLIANVAVAKPYRNRGIGRHLMEAALDFVREKRGRWAVLQVRGDNAAALHLYKSLGFEAVGGEMRWTCVTPQGRGHAYPPPGLDTLGRRDLPALDHLRQRALSPGMRWWLEGRSRAPGSHVSLPGAGPRLWTRVGLGIHEWRGVWEKDQLLAAVGVHGSRWQGTGRLSVWVAHERWGAFESSLVQWGVERLARGGVRLIRAECAADHLALAEALSAAGFRLAQHLVNMRCRV